MSIAVADERAERRASVRAQAAAIADAPRPSKRYAVTPGTRLRPTERRRRHIKQRVPVAAPPRRTSSRRRRVLTVAVLLIQVALLLLLLNLPAFKVHTVTVTGASLLSRDSVLQSAAVPEQSIFTIDGEAIRARLAALPWVQSATVTTDLPATVRISIIERHPVMRIRRNGVDTVFADTGAAMPASAALPSGWSLLPVLLDDRVGTTQPVAPALIAMMSTTAQRLRSVLGCGIAAYQWDAGNVFSFWTTSGWRAILGHLDTTDALAGMPAQLATLGALRSQLDFTSPAFGYVDLENPAAPAVAGKPGLPPEVAVLSAA